MIAEKYCWSASPSKTLFVFNITMTFRFPTIMAAYGHFQSLFWGFHLILECWCTVLDLFGSHEYFWFITLAFCSSYKVSSKLSSSVLLVRSFCFWTTDITGNTLRSLFMWALSVLRCSRASEACFLMLVQCEMSKAFWKAVMDSIRAFSVGSCIVRSNLNTSWSVQTVIWLSFKYRRD